MTHDPPPERALFRAGVIAVAAALLGPTLAPAPAAAQDIQPRRLYSRDSTTVVRQSRLQYSDLDLSSAQGARALVERIVAAAEAVCGAAPPIPTAAERRQVAGCRAEAAAGAVRSIHNPAITALAAARNPSQLAAQ